MKNSQVSPQARQQAAAVLELRRRERLKSLIAKAYPHGGESEYRAAIAHYGNPPDQIANFERAGVILQPKQLAFSAWARRLDTAQAIEGEQGVPELAIGGARGGGKSHGVFAQAVIDDCLRYAGLKVLYLRKVGKKAQEQLRDLILSVLKYTPSKPKDGAIDLPNGSKVLVGHFLHEKEIFTYLGLEYDLIIVEEYTTLTAAAHEAIRQACRTSKEGWRPRLYISTNPLGVGHLYFKKRFVDHERKNEAVTSRTRKFIPATIDDNQFINQDYRGELDSLQGVAKRAYRFGDWDISAGAYFEHFNYGRHVVETLDAKTLEGWRVWASMDYGYNHYNVIYLHAKTPDGVFYTFAELAHRKHHPDEIAPHLTNVLKIYGLTPERLTVFLAGSDMFNKTGAARSSVAEQWRGLGYALTRADTSPGSRVAGATYLTRLLGNPEREAAPRWFITRNCIKLIECLPYLERDPNNSEDVKKWDTDEHGGGGDDPYDAARYGLFYKPVMQDMTIRSSEENPFY